MSAWASGSAGTPVAALSSSGAPMARIWPSWLRARLVPKRSSASVLEALM